MIGESLLARDASGNLSARIATAFPDAPAIVTVAGIHATQRAAYVECVNQERRASGATLLTPAEETAAWQDAVDLIVEEQAILIRPDPTRMELAFAADEVLQTLLPKYQIKFLYTTNQGVRQAIKQRGECWRIVPLPTSAGQMQAMILRARIGIGGRRIYYYNAVTGTRLLTVQEFAGLAALPAAELRAHLEEIRQFAPGYNRFGYPEIGFFLAGGAFGAADFASHDFAALSEESLREVHGHLTARFRSLVPPPLHEDNPQNLEWRNRMFGALLAQSDVAVPEEALAGLSPEFYMQINWLPGARIEEGELLFDSIYAEPPGAAEPCRHLVADEERIRGIIFNLIREYGDLEYVNLGRVIGSLADRPGSGGRRDVFVTEVKRRGDGPEILQVLRLAKWGTREHLEEGADLLSAMMQAEEYADYVLDRRLACRQLGMNLPGRLTARRLAEIYRGTQTRYHGTRLWATYFERDYLRGVASSKLTPGRLALPGYAVRLAYLLGEAAAPNLIVGRTDVEGKVVFDDGDEIVIEDESGLPCEVMVADPTGCFTDYQGPLEKMADRYALPVTRRRDSVPDLSAFAAAYLEGFITRFMAIQTEYRRRRRAFGALFQHRPQDPEGAFGFRWPRVLERLDAAEAETLAQGIRAAIGE